MKAYRKQKTFVKNKNAECLHNLLHKVSFTEMLTVELALFASNLGFILSAVC